MIILYKYAPAFGIPSASPFCVKAEILLKMAKANYDIAILADPRKAPRGKLPYIKDGDAIIADSTHICRHLEANYTAEFTTCLSDRERATGHAFATMIEERLYWAILHSRWMDETNWPRVRQELFAPLPAIMRPLIARMTRKGVRADLHSHGLGRHTETEIYRLAATDLETIAVQLDYNDYFMGDHVTSFDASVYPFLSAILLASLESPLKDIAERHEAFRPY
ncbi:MAG: glutathione S-transferase family protein, partial [Fimbriimonadaceae bacterium]|nr:glutathione S-transferase family protein [Alphaproteobacteria bacterium]